MTSEVTPPGLVTTANTKASMAVYTPPAPAPSLPSADSTKQYHPDIEDEYDDISADAFDEDEEYDTQVQQTVGTNRGTIIGTQILQEIQRLHGYPLPTKSIASYLSTYVPPDNIQDIFNILDSNRVVVLYADPGTGRYTTAIHLLHERTRDRIQQVRREPEEKFSPEGTREKGVGWILDLRAENEKQDSQFGLRLANSFNHLQEQDSYLVVVTHAALWEIAGSQASHLGIMLSPPPAREVLRAHLGVPRKPIGAEQPVVTTSGQDGQAPPRQPVPVQDGENTQGHGNTSMGTHPGSGSGKQNSEGMEIWLDVPSVKKGIENRTPKEIIVWAEAIRNVEEDAMTLYEQIDAAEQEKRFQQKIELVVGAAHDWRTHLREWNEKNTESEYRNYLLAAAALDGAPAEIIRKASESLAIAFGERLQQRPGQQGKGIIELTYAINAELAEDDTIRFPRPGYAEAVVDYFWLDRPNLVPAFTKWIANQLTNLPQETAQRLADRVGRWALRYSVRKRTVALLRDIAEQWAREENLIPCARDLLAVAAVDPDLGQRVRNEFLNWAKEDKTETTDTTKHLKIVLSEVCRQLGAVFPTIMLRRLAEMANSPDDSVIEAVGHALNELWSHSELRSRIRNAIQNWEKSEQPARRKAAYHAFVHLAARRGPSYAPALLIDCTSDSTGLAWVTNRWRGVFVTKPTSTVQDAFNCWMSAIVESNSERELIFQIFEHAVHHPTDEKADYSANRYLNLSHLLYAWEPSNPTQPPTERTQVRDELLSKVRESDPARSNLSLDVSTS